MKSLKIFAAALAAFALLSITNVDAQSKKEGWQDKIKSEKIGFITVELNLTPEEAQVFWPVYNEIANKKAELQKQVRESYKALLKALNEEGTTDKEIDKLLDNYLAAKQAVKDAGKGEVDKYRKVLPSKKVAKLYVAEEKFRRQHIRNLGGHKPQGHPQGKPQGGPHGSQFGGQHGGQFGGRPVPPGARAN